MEASSENNTDPDWNVVDAAGIGSFVATEPGELAEELQCSPNVTVQAALSPAVGSADLPVASTAMPPGYDTEEEEEDHEQHHASSGGEGDDTDNENEDSYGGETKHPRCGGKSVPGAGSSSRGRSSVASKSIAAQGQVQPQGQRGAVVMAEDANAFADQFFNDDSTASGAAPADADGSGGEWAWPTGQDYAEDGVAGASVGEAAVAGVYEKKRKGRASGGAAVGAGVEDSGGEGQKKGRRGRRRKGERPGHVIASSASGPSHAAVVDEERKVSRDEAVMELEQRGEVRFVVVRNDGAQQSLLLLTELRNLFAGRLPNMPAEYLTRLVFDYKHESLVLMRANVIVGGITYRAVHLPHAHFSEIAFCAVAPEHQLHGFGARMMNHVKARNTAIHVTHILTYADKDAIKYFKKQGFTKEISLERDKWEGHIKHYDGAVLMECRLYGGIDYTNIPAMIRAKKLEINHLIDTNAETERDKHALQAILTAKRLEAASVMPAIKQDKP